MGQTVAVATVATVLVLCVLSAVLDLLEEDAAELPDRMRYSHNPYGSFRNQGVPYSGVLRIRILLLRVLY